jgi:acetolactate synthase I/II/III large subunit
LEWFVNLVDDGGMVVAKALRNAGVGTVMTMAGGHVSSIFQGLKAEGIRSVLFRDERATSFAAAAWGAMTRHPGICLITAGPGLTNTVTGLAQAQRAGWPVVSIAGCFESFAVDMGGLQELDQAALMAPISKWSRTVPDSKRIGEYVERALQQASTPPFGHAHLSIPVDLLSAAFADRPPLRDAAGYLASRSGALPPDAAQQIADLLAQAERPVLLAGTGVWFDRGEDALNQLVDRIGIPTFTEDEGRGMLPDSHPSSMGPLLYGISGASKLVREADLVLVIGCKPDWRLDYLRAPLISPGAVMVQIDSNPEHLTGNYETRLSVQCSEAGALGAIAELAVPSGTRWDGWRVELKDAFKRHIESILAEARTVQGADVVHPVTVTEIVREACLRDDANVIFDGGTTGKWGKLLIPATRPGQWNRLKGPFASIGHGLPSAVARSLSDPAHPTVVLTGDGAFGYHAVDVETAVNEGAVVTVIIATDGAWGSVQEGQLKTFNDVEGTVIPHTRFGQVAAALGAKGYWVEDADTLRSILAEPHEGVRIISVKSETVFPPVRYPPGRYARGDS